MPLPDFLIYLALGRLITWLLQTAGLLAPIWRSHRLLTELAECDLCLGFWVYLALGLLSDASFGWWPQLLDITILAALTSFAAHLLRLGWQAKFSITYID